MAKKRASRRPAPLTLDDDKQATARTAKKTTKKTTTKKKATKKKPTKKRATKKKKTTPWDDPANRDLALDTMFDEMVGAAQEVTGRNDIVAADEAEFVVICLPFPHLCWKYLWASQGYPFGRLMHLFGPQGSCKSALATELIRWHLQAGGLGVVMENENKDTPDLRRSILQEQKLLRRCRTHPVNSMQEWQAAQTFWTDTAKKKAIGTKDSPGRVIPYCMVVDSIMGTATEDELSKIESSGSAGRGQFGIGANMLSNYCRATPGQLRREPVSVIWVNHQKPKSDPNARPGMPPGYTTPGGRAVGFYASMELEVKRTKYIKLANTGGVTLKFTVRKNCVGETGRTIEASMLWEWVETENGHQQVTFWDWHSATTDLLVRMKTGGSEKLKNQLKEVCDIQVASGRRAHSKVLGVPKDNPISFHEFGKLLESRTDVVAALEPVLGIAARPLYRPYVDFHEQIDDSIQRADYASEIRYTDSEAPAGAIELGNDLAAKAAGYTRDELAPEDDAYVGLDAADE